MQTMNRTNNKQQAKHNLLRKQATWKRTKQSTNVSTMKLMEKIGHRPNASTLSDEVRLNNNKAMQKPHKT